MGARAGETIARRWAARVRANRAQVEEVREAVERDDFYAPVSAHFVDDPRRVGDSTLEALLALARPEDRWLDIGAGAGRYALPLALAAREVIAVEPSAAMAAALRAGMDEHGIENVRVLPHRWPMEDPPTADVALIAHVGYDVEEIGPFLDAMDRAAGRLCVAVMMERSPASQADPFWQIVHDRQRAPLPALPELLELLRARGARPEVREVERPPRAFADEEQLRTYLRQQLWVQPGSSADQRMMAAVRSRMQPVADGLQLSDAPIHSGIVSWVPRV